MKWLASLACITALLGCSWHHTHATQGSHGYLNEKEQDKAIIFLHGVFGDATSTWRNSKTGAYWPSLVAKDQDFEVLHYHRR